MVTSSSDYVPERGDAVWISFHPQAGHEQAGRRPALVLSPASYNGRVGLALMCPITNKAKGYPFEVPLPSDSAATGVILADQIKSLDWRSRNATYHCTVREEVVAETVRLIGALLVPEEVR